ncbi:MAG: isoprenylcysteine carboxylmethyltransferase family protein [Rhodospirillaceae bacterium]|jgi:methanethiol S-methyltransferase|nr:isoprenylcysteine carboxylmethyltransferase family protein [Rhodospirillaceae bacterium]MBT5375104.1 isoprenylcysteine carboxylmethyltransferase family protein [Rhodospirillaceae bacterium]
MMKALGFLYGIVSYAFAMAALVYGIGFIADLYVPKSIDMGGWGSGIEPWVTNLLLLTLFAVQHSVMARPEFKAWWTKIVPEPIERSTYVLLTGVVLTILYIYWIPMTDIIWNVTNPTIAGAILGLYFLGWVIVVLSTFLINHFDLFGLAQVFRLLKGGKAPEAELKTPFLYKLVRHPIMLGMIIVVWAAPMMTLGHLVFALANTGYVLIALQFEERDLISIFGDTYREYQKKVPMVIPLLKRKG